MVDNFFDAHQSEVRVEDDLDLLVKGYMHLTRKDKKDRSLVDEIYSEVKGRVKSREAEEDGQEQGGVKGAEGAARKR